MRHVRRPRTVLGDADFCFAELCIVLVLRSAPFFSFVDKCTDLLLFVTKP